MTAVSWKAAPFKDLETRGFVLAPSFLSPEELTLHRNEFEQQPVDTDNRNYNLSPVRGRAHDAIVERVKEVLALVAASTDLRPDFPMGGSYFATRRGMSYLMTSTQTPVETLVANYLRKRGLVR